MKKENFNKMQGHTYWRTRLRGYEIENSEKGWIRAERDEDPIVRLFAKDMLQKYDQELGSLDVTVKFNNADTN